MKKLSLGLLATFLFTGCSNKKEEVYFEGTILYTHNIKLKTDKLRMSYLDSIIGSKAFLYYKNGSYYEIYDKGFPLEEIYNVSENKIYFKKNLSDTLFWSDCKEPPKPMERYEINKGKEVINGITCDEYITYYKNKTVTFYFNPDSFKIDPAWYKDFTVGNKNVNSERMGAMYIRYVMEYPDFIVSITASEITKKPINDSLVKIKPGRIIVKDPNF